MSLHLSDDMISILACPSAHVQLGFTTFHPGHLIPPPDIFSRHPVGKFPGNPLPLITLNNMAILRLYGKIGRIT